jgi:protein required for attachment to host cells
MTATWVLVADSSRAKLFSADKALAPLQEIEHFSHPAGRAKNQDLTSDRQGRSSDNLRMMDYDVDPKRQEAIIFAKQLTAHLRSGRHRGSFQKLYIAAAPTFLGILRDKLDPQTAQLVAAEVNKDLTQLDAAEIRRHLPERL